MTELLGKSLRFRAHNSSHSGLNRTDYFERATTIIIYDFEFKLLVQFELVFHLYDGLEVGV